MKLVVTGASGFIGHNVLLRAPREWNIVAVYHSTPGLEAFVEAARASPTSGRCVRSAERKPTCSALARTIGEKPDAMLYLAANGDPAASSERPRWDLESNTVAFVTCLEHCPADHVVYLSSGAVYDGLQRRRVAGDAGVAAAAVRDLEAGLGAVPAVLLPSTAAPCRATSTCASSAPMGRMRRRARSPRGGCRRWRAGRARVRRSAATART